MDPLPDAQLQLQRFWRSVILIFVIFFVSLAFSIKVFNATTYGKNPSGSLSEVVSTGIVYLPPVFFTGSMMIQNRFMPQERTIVYKPKGSLALRALTAILTVLCIIFRCFQVGHCFATKGHPHDVNDEEHFDPCASGVLIERFMSSAFTTFTGFFVYFNHYVPRRTIPQMISVAFTVVAAVYMYGRFNVIELALLYEEVFNTTHHDPEERTLVDAFLEAFYVCTAETTVVVASTAGLILIGFAENPVVLVPNPVRNADHDRRQKKIISLWIVLIFFATLAAIILNVQFYATFDSSEHRLKFTICVCILHGISLILIYKIWSNSSHHDDYPIGDEQLDRALLYFGLFGCVFYSCVSLMNAVLLCIGSYDNIYAIPNFFLHFSSLIQIYCQAFLLLHRSISSTNIYSLIFLWSVNMTMFVLDVLDASSLGIYASPMSPDENVHWNFFMRGLIVFSVFFRFHSSAIIAEQVDHLLEHEEHGEHQEDVGAPAVFDQENGFNPENHQGRDTSAEFQGVLPPIPESDEELQHLHQQTEFEQPGYSNQNRTQITVSNEVQAKKDLISSESSDVPLETNKKTPLLKTEPFEMEEANENFEDISLARDNLSFNLD